MVKISFSYPYQDNAKFDHEYFHKSHMKLVSDRWSPMGMVSYGVEKGLSGGDPGSNPTYIASAYVIFNVIEDFQKALEAHGGDIVGDVPNYTDLQPVIQVNEIVV